MNWKQMSNRRPPREEFPQPHPKRPRLDNNPAPLQLPRNNLPEPAMLPPPLHPPPNHSLPPPPPVPNQQRKGYAASIFFKTKTCRSMLVNGFCEYGDSCHFAHGQHELRKPPPNWTELVNAKDENRFHANGQNRTRFWKTRLCRAFQSTGGHCPQGNGCSYAHGSAELQQANVGAVVSNRANVEACAAPSEQPTVPSILDALPIHVVLPVEQPQPTATEGIEVQEEEEEVAKRRVPKKLAGIYGDWIEGYSL